MQYSRVVEWRKVGEGVAELFMAIGFPILAGTLIGLVLNYWGVI